MDLTEIEQTFELSPLPADDYLPISRVVEVVGIEKFKEPEKKLPKTTSYKEAFDMMRTVYNKSEYTSKNVLTFMAMAKCKWPWVDEFDTGESEFVVCDITRRSE